MNRENESSLVWYACYGSNMDVDRFLKYLQGGTLTTVEGFRKQYQPCVLDNTPPRNSEPYIVYRKLLFGLQSKSWGGRGVAFISNQQNKYTKSLARIYLISKVQFNHLFAGENGRLNVNIDYELLIQKGKLDFEYRMYGRLLLIEKSYKGYPVLTFTNRAFPTFNTACTEYISFIARGIIDTHKICNGELLDYFVRTRTGFSKKQLKAIINKL